MQYLRKSARRVFAASVIILLVPMTTATADDLEFVCLPQEATFLLYEEWSFEFLAINNTESPIEYRPLMADDQFIYHRITDATGNVLEHPYLTAEYVPWLKQEIPPHDTALGSATIVYGAWGPNVDPMTGLATLDPGEYTVEFIWLYDPHARALFGGSKFLYDTAHITVIMPSGPDSLAMDMYVKANVGYRRGCNERPGLEARREAIEERSKCYVDIFESHPATCFGRMALEKVINFANMRYLPEFDGHRLSDLAASYAFRYPERPFAQASMRDLAVAHFIPDHEKSDVLRKVADSLEHSPIGRLARTLIDDPYEGRKRR